MEMLVVVGGTSFKQRWSTQGLALPEERDKVSSNVGVSKDLLGKVGVGWS